MTSPMKGVWKCILCEQLNPENSCACRGCGLEPSDAFDVEVAIVEDLSLNTSWPRGSTAIFEERDEDDDEDIEDLCGAYLADSLGG